MPQPAELYSTKSDFAYTTLREKVLSGQVRPRSSPSTRRRSRGPSGSAPPRCARRCAGSSPRGSSSSGHTATRRSPICPPEEARDLLEVRRSLDPLAAALAAERRTKADITAIQEAAGIEPLRRNFGVDHLRRHTAASTPRSTGPPTTTC